MISTKLLRKLPKNTTYVVYDSLYEYVLKKHDDESYHINVYGWRETMYIHEKDLEHLKINAVCNDDDESGHFYRYTYIDNGYTNKYQLIGSIGLLYSHSDFYGFSNLSFFGEYKGEQTIEEVRKFKKTLKRKGKFRD